MTTLSQHMHISIISIVITVMGMLCYFVFLQLARYCDQLLRKSSKSSGVGGDVEDSLQHAVSLLGVGWGGVGVGWGGLYFISLATLSGCC